jgi:hypothetical protein
MKIYTVRNFTTAHELGRNLLSALAQSASSTSCQSTVFIESDKSTSMSKSVGITTSGHLSSARDHDAITLQSDNDELNWRKIVTTPHVQRGLCRLAAEARRQAIAGEIEEGGFVVE